MNCPGCGKNGINTYTKIILLFDLPVVCRKCHLSFSITKGFRTFSKVFSATVIVIVVMSSLSGKIEYLLVCVCAGLIGAWIWSITIPLSIDNQSHNSTKLMEKLRNVRK